jgi:tetratricopeptide (TPR) repeat protein
MAIELAPGLADAWLNLGLICFRLGEIGNATQAMERALLARPGYGLAEANLASFLLLQGDQEEALARLRSVLDRDPGCVPARLNLANALLLDREGAAALALLAGAPPGGREGAHWRAHRAMALLLLRRNAEASAELDAIGETYDAEILIAWRRLVLAERDGDEATALAHAARLAELADGDGAALLEHRIVSHFDLASFRGRRRETGPAFAHWNAGHALLRRVQPFSRQRFTAFVEASMSAYDRTRLHNGPRAATTDETPVFIVGMPRSGTSLAEQVLAAHPLVHGAGERPELHRTIVRLAGPPLDPATIPSLAALDGSVLTTASECYGTALRALGPAAARVTDKMPGSALHLGFLSTLLPGARVILCWRDPRDIGLSIYQLRFFGYHPYAHDLSDLGWYIGQHERLMSHWRAVLPIPLLELALAEWIEDFGGTLRRVLDFVGLPYNTACERFYEQRRRVRTASADQVRQPINASGLGRWREYKAELAPMIAELEAAGLVSHDSLARPHPGSMRLGR